jgi:hypothetical protein
MTAGRRRLRDSGVNVTEDSLGPGAHSRDRFGRTPPDAQEGHGPERPTNNRDSFVEIVHNDSL